MDRPLRGHRIWVLLGCVEIGPRGSARVCAFGHFVLADWLLLLCMQRDAHIQGSQSACWGSLALPILAWRLRLESQPSFDDRARESRGDDTPRLGGVDEFHDHPLPLVPKISHCHQRHQNWSSPCSSSFLPFVFLSFLKKKHFFSILPCFTIIPFLHFSKILTCFFYMFLHVFTCFTMFYNVLHLSHVLHFTCSTCFTCFTMFCICIRIRIRIRIAFAFAFAFAFAIDVRICKKLRHSSLCSLHRCFTGRR